MSTALTLMAPFAAHAGAPTFQELMKPECFPQPQRGMVVESATLNGDALRVVTTGARINANLSAGEVVFAQRIGHERPVVRLRFGAPLRGARLTHKGRGFVLATLDRPKVTIRINGDSLFMLQAHELLRAEVDRLMSPAWDSSWQTDHLLADEWGGFGLYCSEGELVDHYDAYAKTVARYELPAGAVLWVAVCPPKPYDWERSLKDNVVWHWSNELAYPPDDVLKSWKDLGNIVLLQSEVMLWKDWNLDFVPRLGPEEFARVRRTLHDLSMRFIVYTSPYYFVKGTALEGQAMNSFENFKGWPPGSSTGENIELFMDAITLMMKEHRPDGLYFDGQYTTNPAALYALARRTRALLGEDGILEWHSTTALGDRLCYLPQADAYVDFILRGEGVQSRYADYDYLRFFVSGYNVSNSIGVLCNNGPTGVTPQLAQDVLKANARFHTIASWTANENFMKALREDYQTHLNPQLRATVEKATDQRQAEVGAKAARRQAELEALSKEPHWGEPLFRQTFSTLPAAKQILSSQNEAPFSVADGALHVRAHAHTYAFLSLPLQGKVRGLVLRLRQDTDGGMSWGPGVLVRFANGATVRVGTRSDGKLQADVLGGQLYGGLYHATDWVWLRARWLEQWGVVERSDDGKTFVHVWTFEHAGLLNDAATELLVGKVPYNGEARDYTEAGPLGECEVGWVGVY